MTGAESIVERAAVGEVVVIDGGMGTELEARGAPMDTHAWSAMANIRSAELVQRIHEDYILAGAEVIITNTFAAARPPLAAAGLGHQVVEINHAGAEAAIAARRRVRGDGTVVVAGSLSHVQMGASPREWPADGEGLRDVFREEAVALADAGVDVLIVEMATAEPWVLAAADAALETGLPLWVGLSFEPAAEDGVPMLKGEPEQSLENVLSALAARGVSALFVMHTDIDLVDDALLRVLAAATVPVGVYPHSGTFESPHWIVGTISPEALAARTTSWIEQGARLAGGCCGIGPSHIRAIAKEARTWNSRHRH
jgi:S-methylmethionine-dependent homocysteine/selenocysteine methylase